MHASRAYRIFTAATSLEEGPLAGSFRLDSRDGVEKFEYRYPLAVIYDLPPFFSPRITVNTERGFPSAKQLIGRGSMHANTLLLPAPNLRIAAAGTGFFYFSASFREELPKYRYPSIDRSVKVSRYVEDTRARCIPTGRK